MCHLPALMMSAQERIEMIDEAYKRTQQEGQQEFNAILLRLKAAIKARDPEKIITEWNELIDKQNEYEGLRFQADDFFPIVGTALEAIYRTLFGEIQDSSLVTGNKEIWQDDEGHLRISIYDEED